MFDLDNTTKFFAKMMKQMVMVLGIAHNMKIAFSFVDDTCIYARNWDELMERLSIILGLLQDAVLTIGLQKYQFGKSSVEFLCYTLGKGKINPGKRKNSAITEL